MSAGPSPAHSTLVRAQRVRDPCARSVSQHARSAVAWSRGGAPPWMTFLRELNSTLTFQEIASVYRHACDLTSTPAGDPGLANSCTLTWIDQQLSIQPDPMTPATLVQHYGFLSGGAGVWGGGR